MKLTMVTWYASITGTKLRWERGAFWLVDDLGDLAGAWQEGLVTASRMGWSSVMRCIA
jgi:hypothetical protein